MPLQENGCHTNKERHQGETPGVSFCITPSQKCIVKLEGKGNPPSFASLAIEWKKAQSLCKTCMQLLCLIREHNGELGSYSWFA